MDDAVSGVANSERFAGCCSSLRLSILASSLTFFLASRKVAWASVGTLVLQNVLQGQTPKQAVDAALCTVEAMQV